MKLPLLTFAVDSLIDYMTERELTQKVLDKIGIPLGNAQIKTMKERRDSRWVIQTRILEEIKAQVRPKHFTPFFIRSPDAHRDYWLLHLSGHSRARDVMVDLHWKENTSFIHYGRSGINMLGYDPDEDPRVTRQSFLPEFCFDLTARASTQEALLGELPKKLFDSFRKGISFGEFFTQTTNETPATSQIMAEALIDLAKAGEIDIRSAAGSIKRRSALKSSDILIPSKQRRLFLPNS